MWAKRGARHSVKSVNQSSNEIPPDLYVTGRIMSDASAPDGNAAKTKIRSAGNPMSCDA
jgi:hypothetical protein